MFRLHILTNLYQETNSNVCLVVISILNLNLSFASCSNNGIRKLLKTLLTLVFSHLTLDNSCFPQRFYLKLSNTTAHSSFHVFFICYLLFLTV